MRRVEPRSSSSSWRSPTCATRPTSSRRSTSAPPGSTAAARSRSRRCSPTTPTATIEQAADAARQGRARQPLHQDPGHRGRPAGDRGVDLRRHPDQRHPALLARAVPGRRRRLHAGDRTADRGRARPRRRLGRLDLHEPLGRRRRRRGAGRAAQPARARGRLPRLPRLPGAARLPAHAAADERGRAPAAPALGEHRDQGSRSLRHPLHRGLRLAVHRQHDARADAARLRRPRRGRRPRSGRRRRRRAGAGGVRRGRHRRRRAGRAPPGGGQGGLRQVLGGAC